MLTEAYAAATEGEYPQAKVEHRVGIMNLRYLARKIVVPFFWALFLFAALSLLTVAGLRWFDPPTSSFMIQHRISAWLDGREQPYVHHEWTDWEAIPPAVPLAFVAAEDQRFPLHSGFDLVEIEKAWTRYRSGGRLRGASTISQQVAKNLFLWRDKSMLRKGLEACLTLAIELTWPKRRILEVYINLAQLSADTYGVGAASWRYFDRPAQALGTREAALLAAVLPNPVDYRLDGPSAHVRKRAAWVRKQMRQLGSGYLDGL
jgi:monofunctional biosynthetic peptidoglycan transglycosylase